MVWWWCKRQYYWVCVSWINFPVSCRGGDAISSVEKKTKITKAQWFLVLLLFFFWLLLFFDIVTPITHK